jgi:hypothetical protein
MGFAGLASGRNSSPYLLVSVPLTHRSVFAFNWPQRKAMTIKNCALEAVAIGTFTANAYRADVAA